MSDYDVVIAGGGHNALACGAFLSLHGLDVLIAVFSLLRPNISISKNTGPTRLANPVGIRVKYRCLRLSRAGLGSQ